MASGTWCLPTKEYGFAGLEAPRPRRRRHGRAQRRGASRRKNKDLRVLKHHVHDAEGTDGLRDVVPKALPFFSPLKKLHAGGNLGRGVRRLEPLTPAVADRMFDNPGLIIRQKKLHAGGNLGRGKRRLEPQAPAVADRMFDNPTKKLHAGGNLGLQLGVSSSTASGC